MEAFQAGLEGTLLSIYRNPLFHTNPYLLPHFQQALPRLMIHNPPQSYISLQYYKKSVAPVLPIIIVSGHRRLQAPFLLCPWLLRWLHVTDDGLSDIWLLLVAVFLSDKMKYLLVLDLFNFLAESAKKLFHGSNLLLLVVDLWGGLSQSLDQVWYFVSIVLVSALALNEMSGHFVLQLLNFFLITFHPFVEL